MKNIPKALEKMNPGDIYRIVDKEGPRNIIVKIVRVMRYIQEVDTIDLCVIKGPKLNRSEGRRKWSSVALRKAEFTKLSKKEYPEYFLWGL